MLESNFLLEAVLKLLWVGGCLSIIGNNANSVQLQLQLPTGTELSKILLQSIRYCFKDVKVLTFVGAPRSSSAITAFQLS